MDATFDAETVGDALDVLHDIVLWELPAARWEQVGALLERAGAARDAEELRAAVAELGLSGPTRALRIGSSPATGIPEPVLARRNRLVHALARTRPPEPPDLSEPAGLSAPSGRSGPSGWSEPSGPPPPGPRGGSQDGPGVRPAH